MARSSKRPDLVGLVEVAAMLDVKPATVYRWRGRNVLPTPDWFLSGSPIWYRTTVVEWAVRTGRKPEESAPLAA